MRHRLTANWLIFPAFAPPCNVPVAPRHNALCRLFLHTSDPGRELPTRFSTRERPTRAFPFIEGRWCKLALIKVVCHYLPKHERNSR